MLGKAILRELCREALAIRQLADLRRGARAGWAAGDVATVAGRDIWEAGERVVRRAGVRPGEDVLDVARGTGVAAIRAAQAGGRVVGVDLAPEPLEVGRREAAEAGVVVEWLGGDADALPVADESFDVVLSAFGCMFAPRHEVTARELARALRPGGRMALCAWTAEGVLGRLLRTLGGHVQPLLWGSEEHVRRLFAGTGVELRFERETLDAELEPAEYLVTLGLKPRASRRSPQDRRLLARSRHEEGIDMATTKEIGDQNVAAWRARDVEAFAALYSDDAELAGPGVPPLVGKDGARQIMAMWCGAFPDNEITFHAEHVAGETIVYEATFTGTHTGDLPTPDGGAIPATGRTVVGRFAEFFTIRDGLIRSDRIYFDQVELLVQLGLMPDPAEAAHA